MSDQANPFEGYNQSAAELKQDPKALETEKLCWMFLQESANGRRLWELLVEQVLTPPRVDPTHAQCKEVGLYFEGYRRCIIDLKRMSDNHQARINASGPHS